MKHCKDLYAKGVLHNKKMITQSQIPDVQFQGTISIVKNLMDALKSLNINTGTTALFHINQNGLEVTVEDSNCFQAILYVTQSAFSSFSLNGLAQFNINLSILCECLSIFHIPDTSVKMLYKGNGAPLGFMMEDLANNNCVIECSIKTQTESEPLVFDDDAKLNQIVLRAGQFLEILGEVDKACDELQLTLSPKSPYFRARTMGTIQSATEFQVDKKSDSIISFNCKQRTCFSYKMAQLKILMRSLPLATKISISTDQNGLLTCHVILLMNESQPADDDTKMYIVYSILPLSSSIGAGQTETEETGGS